MSARVRAGWMAAACLALMLLPALAQAKGGLAGIESEFERAIQRVSPCTVVCIPRGVDPKRVPMGSSGVIVSGKGLVLSDKDVGLYLDAEPSQQTPRPKVLHSDEVEVRIPNLKGRGFASYDAKVIRRINDLDTALLQIEKPPSGLKSLDLGDSDSLKVGDFTFAMGNAFGLAAEVPPTLTAGVVSALVPNPGGTDGRYTYVYTSAAVNQGVNGGPLVDVEGRLVGTVSGLMLPTEPANPFQFLGKVVPIARIRSAYQDLDAAKDVFAAQPAASTRSQDAAMLGEVFHATARRAGRSVLSVEVARTAPVSSVAPAGAGTVATPRYQGPISAVVVSDQGHLLTSLYNLCNIGQLVEPVWRMGRARVPDDASLEGGIKAISAMRVHVGDGRVLPTQLIAYHEGLGIALLQALWEGEPPSLLEAAPPQAYQAGRFVLALGNPFGADRLPDPLLTAGILSKQHDAALRLPGAMRMLRAPWAGMWQIDAGLTDANCGGAAVDLQGRFLGITHIWSPLQHGRSSGIGFFVPWPLIQAVLEEMKTGRTYSRPLLGVTWREQGPDSAAVIGTVDASSAAARAGLKVGDTILRVNGHTVTKVQDAVEALSELWSGDDVKIEIERETKKIEYTIKLGRRGAD